jgi:lysozyme family protein
VLSLAVVSALSAFGYRQSVDAPYLDQVATHYVREDRLAEPLRHFAEFVAHPTFHVRMSTQT